MSATIIAVKARQILDSRGQPTLEVEVTTDSGVFRAAVPSGASTGIYEALELRDGDKSKYNGKGVLTAISNVNTIIGPVLIGKSVEDQAAIDNFMVQDLDGTKDKSKLGANAILGVSMAVARAGAAAAKRPLYAYIAQLAGRNPDAATFTLPVPFFNVLNAGSHSGAPLVFQEIMFAPIGAPTFSEAMRIGSEIYAALKVAIKKSYGAGSTGVGDEGGFAPDLADPVQALDLLQTAIAAAGHTGAVKIAMDVAASEFCVPESSPPIYDLHKKKGGEAGKLSGAALLALYADLVAKYPIVSIEDLFDQDDWELWAAATSSLGAAGLQIVADDLTVTNTTRVSRAITEKSANCLLLKVNQIGSVTEAIAATNMAQSAGWGVMASHRSGETEDTFLADLAVGLSTGQLKSGAPARSERTAKYNQLLRIEEELGARAVYAGASFRTAGKL